MKINPLAHKFAERISSILSLPEHRSKFREQPLYEHKSIAPLIQAELVLFLRAENLGETDFVFDWEGNSRKSKQQHSYPVLGTWTHPDAAVLSPFKCAFEIDRENKQAGSGFKDALMKASVHVLSGKYESCVFVYVLKSGQSEMYLDDEGKVQTEHLITLLKNHGLFVSIIPP